MTVALSQELEQRLKDKVASGEYRSVEEAVATAVENLLDEGGRAGAWDGVVTEAQEQIRRGEYADDDALFDELLSDKPKV